MNHKPTTFNSLTTTGGMQPFGGLQTAFKAERVETGFIDRPAFAAAGRTFFADFTAGPTILHDITSIG